MPEGDVIITANYAKYDDRIVVGGTSTVPNPCELTGGKNYTAAPYSGNGGALEVQADGTVTGTDVTFAGNSVSGYGKSGGAICNQGKVSLTGAAFTGNTSQTNGGAIFNNGTVTIAGDATFSGNTAGKDGGTIWNSGTVNMKNNVSLETATDTVFNSGILNWDLTGGTIGNLKGYQPAVRSLSRSMLNRSGANTSLPRGTSLISRTKTPSC